MTTPVTDNTVQWYVMRDLTRWNSRHPAYRLLGEMGMEVFVPMVSHVRTCKGVHVRDEVPFIQDLLFVHESQSRLDVAVEDIPTLQYRWLRNTWRQPMTVDETRMDRFIRAVAATDFPKYYLPSEITPAMYGRTVRIVGGPLNGFEGGLITTRGSKVKRLLVELPGFLAAGVEVSPEFIQLVR